MQTVNTEALFKGACYRGAHLSRISFPTIALIYGDIVDADDRREMTRSIAVLKLFLERVLTHKIDTGHTNAAGDPVVFPMFASRTYTVSKLYP